jgi:hypothetical protein
MDHGIASSTRAAVSGKQEKGKGEQSGRINPIEVPPGPCVRWCSRNNLNPTLAVVVRPPFLLSFRRASPMTEPAFFATAFFDPIFPF